MSAHCTKFLKLWQCCGENELSMIMMIVYAATTVQQMQAFKTICRGRCPAPFYICKTGERAIWDWAKYQLNIFNIYVSASALYALIAKLDAHLFFQ